MASFPGLALFGPVCVMLDISASSLVVAAEVGLVAGILIGCIGVGGVIIVPCLILLPDVDVSRAVPACMFSYIFAGLVGLVTFGYKKQIDWRDAAAFCASAAPSALLGAWLFAQISPFAIKITMYTVIFITSLFSLIRILWSRRNQNNKTEDSSVENKRDSSAWCLSNCGIWLQILVRLSIGLFAGCASALTGTSGPVVLLPILIILRWDIKLALGSAQAIQFPIAVASTIGNAFFGKKDIDFKLGGSIAATLAPFVILGALIANRLPAKPLKTAVSLILILASLSLLIWEIEKLRQADN
ncbi:uncharacterized protein [Oscarella lobularis]|uniref:uncharacterized protein n=1 Tax=Oscarella lobularis TaxID=121494 RepID=UPI003313E9AC